MNINSNFSQGKKFLPLLLVVAGLGLAFSKPLTNMVSSAKLDLEIQRQPILMPSVYKVYANENALDGRFSLFKMLVTNNTSTTAKNVEVAFDIPGFIEKKTIAKFPVILPGQSVVVNCYPSFPEKIVDKTTSSKEQVNIHLTGSNIKTQEQNFGIDIKGRNEFMYSSLPADEIRTSSEMFDNMKLLSCLVTPEDPIVKYFTQKIQEKVLKGEAAAVYNSEKEGVRFMTGVYNATLMSNMVYSGTSGVPAKVEDVSSLIQSIRLPREVITGKTGLCIELSLLYASIMMTAGMDPIIYLVPGHAYPGFRMNGRYYAIESTGIGGEGMGGRSSAEKALQVGMKQLEEFFKAMQMGDDRYMIVDVRESIKNGAVAMELKDDTYLRQKVDEIATLFEPRNTNTQVQYVSNEDNNGNPNPEPNPNPNPNTDNNPNPNPSPNPSGYKSYQGIVNFAYPTAWKVQPRNPQSPSFLKQIISNSSNLAYVEVYHFPNSGNPAQGLEQIRNALQQYGLDVQYSSTGQHNGYNLYNGATYYNGGSLSWIASLKATGNGVVGIIVGVNGSAGNKYQETLMTILKSLR